MGEMKCLNEDINRRCDVVYGYEHGFADGIEEGKGCLEQIRWERDIAMSQLEDIGASFGLKMSLWLAEHDKDVRNKTIEEMRNIFCEDFFNRFAWDDGTMNFNNCSLMMREIIEKLKEGEGMGRLELTKSAINSHGYVDIDRKNLEAIEAEIRADERSKTIEKMAIRLLNEMDNMNIQRTVMNVVNQMKEGGENGKSET